MTIYIPVDSLLGKKDVKQCSAHFCKGKKNRTEKTTGRRLFIISKCFGEFLFSDNNYPDE